MSVHVEPKPLHGPLPGGAPGKPSVAVEPLLSGDLRVPRAFFERTGGRFEMLDALGLTSPRSSWLRAPIPVFLIHHPAAGEVLVDTGLHPSVTARPSANLGRLITWASRPRVQPGEDTSSQLRRRGIDPREIRTVILTHLHLDHTSGISEFENATFVVTAPEWEEATTAQRPLLHGYMRDHFDYLFDYRTIDFDRIEGVTSYATFGRSFDLFGDGSIRLAYTPGHSAGHQSVICRLRDHDFVIAGDAVWTESQLQGGPEPPRPHSRHTWRRSQRELERFAERYPDAIIVPGHDPESWAKLAQRYE